jgi:hypothetical protein
MQHPKLELMIWKDIVLKHPKKFWQEYDAGLEIFSLIILLKVKIL